MADKTLEILVEALKQALAAPVEQRLFRSGKLPGLFAARSGPSAEAAGRALQNGLLEVMRTESKGKIATEWVRLTPQGINFVHDHESPVRVLTELCQSLKVSQQGLPAWLEQMQEQLQALGASLVQCAEGWSQHLEALRQRVEEALRRADACITQVPNGVAPIVPWALDALAYLDRRRSHGVPEPCALPELFTALRQHHADLSVKAFHDGLRRLHDRRALHLLPFVGPASALPEPEFALLEGPTVIYYAYR